MWLAHLTCVLFILLSCLLHVWLVTLSSSQHPLCLEILAIGIQLFSKPFRVIHLHSIQKHCSTTHHCKVQLLLSG